MDTLIIQLAANEVRQYRKAGAYMEVIDAPLGTFDVAFYSVNGGQIDGMRGAMAGYWMRLDYGSFDIINGPTPQTITIMCSDPGERAGSRRQSGVVQVVDGGRDRSYSGVAGITTVTVPAAVGFVSHAQLWNKPGSLQNVIVERVLMSSSVAGPLLLRNSSAGLTTIDGTPVSKMVGGTPLNGQQSRLDNTTLVSPVGSGMMNTHVQANSTFPLDFKSPVIVPPGWGLSVCPQVANQDVRATFEFYVQPL